jgi:hypothetical protein
MSLQTGTQNIKNTVSWNISKGSPDYEKNIRTKMPGYNVVFEFPNCPDPLLKKVSFAAYTKAVTDTFNPAFSGKEVYGRMDPIPVYSRTTRNISFDLDIPSNGLDHSRWIAYQLNILVKNTYPTYQKNGNVNIISSAPLMKVFFSNFITDANNEDLFVLGYPTNGLTIKHDLGNGVFARKSGYEAYPKSYNLSFNLNVLHTYTPGFQPNESGAIKNPVNILLGRYV